MEDHPSDLRYTTDHEWVRVQSQDSCDVGITAFAQDQLGDVVYLNLPEIGTLVQQFSGIGEIESVKAVSEIFSPVTGIVIEINDSLSERPELVNNDPYDQGWILRIKITDLTCLDALLTAEQYGRYLSTEAH